MPGVARTLSQNESGRATSASSSLGYNSPMRLPEKMLGLRLITILWAVYAVLWIIPEGDLTQVMILGAGGAAVAIGQLWQRLLAGRRLALAAWLFAVSAAGVLLGLLGGGLTLLGMVMKTGLHAHGPEFRPAEIAWVAQQTPLWGAAGLLAGLGLGLLLWAWVVGRT